MFFAFVELLDFAVFRIFAGLKEFCIVFAFLLFLFFAFESFN